MALTTQLEAFIERVVPAYPTLQDVLRQFIDGLSVDYTQLNQLMTSAHTSMIQFKHRGVVYNLWRISTMRGTPAYERFKYGIAHEYDSEAERNDPNVAYRLYIDDWLDWHTINLAVS